MIAFWPFVTLHKLHITASISIGVVIKLFQCNGSELSRTYTMNASTRELGDLRVAVEAVVSDPQTLGGELVLKGTRMPVRMVADLRRSGMSLSDILLHYPSLSEELVELSERFVMGHHR
jgi:uncharacterized protein (DUF433 family)